MGGNDCVTRLGKPRGPDSFASEAFNEEGSNIGKTTEELRRCAMKRIKWHLFSFLNWLNFGKFWLIEMSCIHFWPKRWDEEMTNDCVYWGKLLVVEVEKIESWAKILAVLLRSVKRALYFLVPYFEDYQVRVHCRKKIIDSFCTSLTTIRF